MDKLQVLNTLAVKRREIEAHIGSLESIWLYISGAGFLLAAIAIIINKYKRMACYLLAVMVIILILTVRLQPAINQGMLERPLLDGIVAMAAIIIGNNSSR